MPTVNDAVSFERLLLSSPGGSNPRWSDTQLIQATDRAVKHMVGRIRFPESRLTRNTIANQQEYALPELHVIKRVYLNGQPCVPVDIETLEGNQIGIYDQSGQGVPISGSGGPAGAGGSEQPAWVVQTPVTYPFLNSWGSPAPLSQPWGTGQRPRAYIRGGSIGFVPAPGNVGVITIDCVRVPTTLTALTDTIVVPDNFLDGISWKVCEYAAMADDSDRAADQRNYAASEYEREIRLQRTWKRQYEIADSFGPFMRTYRGAFRFGGHRVGGWGDD